MVCRRARDKKGRKIREKKIREIKQLITPPLSTPRADALKKGEATYVGSSCKYGHGKLKFTASYTCVECAKLRTIETNNKIKTERTIRGHKKRGPKPIYTNFENLTKKQVKRSRRRNAEKERTPAWLTETDKWMMREAYSLAKLRSKATGIKWEVDHIIPLRGEYVSGLHVPLNLQVITKTENRKKGAVA